MKEIKISLEKSIEKNVSNNILKTLNDIDCQTRILIDKFTIPQPCDITQEYLKNNNVLIMQKGLREDLNKLKLLISLF
tara:strand:+ start:215 stop:448 length:234 start_codon:yes stop_codon:yes gene_type:complete